MFWVPNPFAAHHTDGISLRSRIRQRQRVCTKGEPAARQPTPPWSRPTRYMGLQPRQQKERKASVQTIAMYHVPCRCIRGAECGQTGRHPHALQHVTVPVLQSTPAYDAAAAAATAVLGVWVDVVQRRHQIRNLSVLTQAAFLASLTCADTRGIRGGRVGWVCAEHR